MIVIPTALRIARNFWKTPSGRNLSATVQSEPKYCAAHAPAQSQLAVCGSVKTTPPVDMALLTDSEFTVRTLSIIFSLDQRGNKKVSQ
jgi:hypothetical protein